MTTMKRVCKDLKDAERFQGLLYLKYNSVTLVDFPTIEESGVYVWVVSDYQMKK